MADLWSIHPFREGNTRTIITFCCFYAEKEGFPLDISIAILVTALLTLTTDWRKGTVDVTYALIR